MIIEGLVTRIDFAISCKIYILYITRAPVWMIIGLIRYDLIFRLNKPVCSESPYIAMLFTRIPGVNIPCFVCILQYGSLVITEPELHVIGEITKNISPANCQLKAFGR